MAQVNDYLEKFRSSDNDFRYMAANDLLDQLNKPEFVMDDNLGFRVVNGLLDLLQDKNSINEVKNFAIKCFGPLSKKITTKGLDRLLERLYEILASTKGEDKELAGLGFKAVVSEVPCESVNQQKSIKPYLVKMFTLLTKEEDQDAQIDLLEIITEIIQRFGSFILSLDDGQIDTKMQSQSLTQLYKLLSHQKSGIKKKASLALGALSSHLDDGLFDELNNKLLDELKVTCVEDHKMIEHAKTLINCFSTICRSDTLRFSKTLPSVVPSIVEYCNQDEDDLRVTCFQALEVFALLCSAKLGQFVSSIVPVCLEYLSYDPHYMDDDDEDNEEEDNGDMEDDGFDDDEFDDEFSNEDDDSWKVRRSSAKLLKALISTSPNQLVYFHETLGPTLTRRFSEREDTVKVEVIHCFVCLLQQTLSQDSTHLGEVSGMDEEYEVVDHITQSIKKRRKIISPIPQANTHTSPEQVVQLISEQVPKIVSKISAQLKSTSVPTQLMSLSLLTELSKVVPGILDSHIDKLQPGITHVLSSDSGSLSSALGSASLQVEAIVLLTEILKTHNPESLYEAIEWICPATLATLKPGPSKASPESFSLCLELINIIKPISQNGTETMTELPSGDSYLSDIRACLVGNINSNSIDQSIRERSIETLGYLIHHTGDEMPEIFDISVELLCKQATSEVSGLAAIKALIDVISSPKAKWSRLSKESTLSKLLAQLVLELIPNLSKAMRSLRVTSLECLNLLLKNLAPQFDQQVFSAIIDQVIRLIHSFQLDELNLALQILNATLTSTLEPSTRQNNVSILGSDAAFSATIKLSQSTHLQGSASEKFSELLSNIVINAYQSKLDTKTITSNYINYMLQPVNDASSNQSLSIQVYYNLALEISSIIGAYASCVQNGQTEFIPMFTKVASDVNLPSHQRQLAFNVLGRLSLKFDLSQYIDLMSVAMESFEGGSAELRFSAAYALGCYAASQLESILPQLISHTKKPSPHRHLFLHAVKEVVIHYITTNQAQSLSGFSDELWNLLLNEPTLQNDDEATRNVIAEIVGKLILAEPDKFLSLLQDQIASEVSWIRSVVIISIRFTFQGDHTNTEEFNLKLKPYIPEFFILLKDEDIQIRKLALMTFNSAAHHRPHLISSSLDITLPLLFKETEVKPELVRIVVMGPFKNSVDDSLDNRKAAYETLYTLLDTLPRYLNLELIVTGPIFRGLKDLHEIKLLSHLLITRMCKIGPTYLKRHLDQLAISLIPDLNSKIKAEAIRTDQEKHGELIRSVLRVISSLAHLSKHHPSPKFDTMLHEALQGPYASEFKKLGI